MEERIKIVVNISGTIRKYSFLLVVLTFCIGIKDACPSTTQSDLLKKVNPALTSEELEELYQYKLDHGIKNLSILSAFLIRSSKKYIKKGEIQKAVEYGEYAQLLAPSYPPVYTHLGKVYWSQNRFRIFSIINSWIDLIKASFNNYSFSLFMLANFLLFLLVSVLLTSAIFSVISIYKYFKLLVHDVCHLLPLNLPMNLVFLWGIFIFSLPFFFQLNIIFIFFIWLILLFIYHSKRGQQVVIIFAFFLLLSPFIIQVVSKSVMTSYSGVFYQLYQVNEESWDSETEQELINWTTQNPDDVDALFSLGLLMKREGKYDDAKRYYEKILENDTSDHKVFCNLGNVLLAKGESDSAIENYNKCLNIFPSSVKSYYNISRAYLLKYMFEESNEYFNKAKEIGSDQVDYYSKIYSNNFNRMVIDETIPTSIFWEETFKLSEEKRQFCSSFWDRFFKGIPYAYWYSTFFVFFILVGLLFVNHHEFGLSISCEYCGCAVCSKCRILAYEDSLCKKCAIIFKSKEDFSMSNREKEKKVIQIERFQKRNIYIGRILSMLLPGAGHIWIDQPFKGSVMLFLFFFFLLKLFYWEGIVLNHWLVGQASSYGGIVMVCCLILILYMYSIMNFSRISGRLYQFLSLIKVTRKGLQIKK